MAGICNEYDEILGSYPLEMGNRSKEDWLMLVLGNALKIGE